MDKTQALFRLLMNNFYCKLVLALLSLKELIAFNLNSFFDSIFKTNLKKKT